ncbi:MAG: hypothetical protein PHC46_05270 [Clostridia bacterium]|jgi:hypothetical protein|nr:hypothetical protein [Clostridia bacterium]
MNERIIKAVCDKYSKKYDCTYNVKQSNTTDSIYIRFYFKDDKRFSIRISNHRKYNSKISSVKPTKDRLERILRKKFIKYEIYKIINFK